MKMSRGIRCIARDGHTCLSLGEKVVCDWLFESGLPHRREVPYGGDRRYLADWEIQGQLVEYLGLTGDDKYDLKTKRKIEYAEQRGLRLIVLYPADLQDVQEAFRKFGIVQPMS